MSTASPPPSLLSHPPAGGGVVHIIKTGAANLASVVAAFDRLGVKTVLTTDPVDAWKAERLVLPGVGAFGAAMAALRAAGLVGPLRERILAGKPTLAICLGLQLFAETSEESPGVTGLGVLPGRVTRFAGGPGLTVPQMGWNRLAATGGASVLRDGWGYYANSYKLDAIPPGWAGAVSDYGGPFVAAVERAGRGGAVVACQFHPELSGPGGLALIARWLNSPSRREGAGGWVEKAEVNAMTGSGRTHPQPPPSPHPGRGLTRVIPCLDVRDGRVVKGVKFQNLRDAGDPAAQAAEYERQGADELVMLDVSATPEGRKTAGDTVRAIRRVLSIPLTVGGGVRTVDDAARLLDAGADKVGVNTAAVERPALIAELAEKFGRQCVVLAIDAARTVEFGVDRLAHPKARPLGMNEPASVSFGTPHLDREDLTPAVWWEVVVHSGKTRTGIDAVAWAERGAELGAGEVLLTSYDRDGTGEGYDLDLLRAVCGAVGVPVIASGGARTAEHLSAAVAAGAGAVLAASIFHDGVHTVGAVKRELAALGVGVRQENE